jgi:DNA polymerase IV
VARLVRAFLETGTIPETESTLASTRYKALTELSTIYGIGPVTARLLYARGVRTIDDLCRWYDVDPDYSSPVASVNAIKPEESGNGIIETTGRATSGSGEDGKEGLIRASLGFRRDLEVKIPRAEVEEIGALVQAHLDAVQPGCVSTICGGYRRGKPESNDVDVIISHPDEDAMEGLCKRVVRRMTDEGGTC